MIAWRDRSNGSNLGETAALFLALAVALTIFGVLMIYSASSIMALITSEPTNHNPAYYAMKQLTFAGVGAVIAAFIWHVDYRELAQRWMIPIWLVTVVLLVMVIATSAGESTYGATRWIRVGPLTIQPSEFAKGTVLLAAAGIIEQLFEGGADLHELGVRSVALVGAPMLLVLIQPDKGTTAVIGVTVLVMLYLAGMSLKVLGVILGVGLVALLILSLGADYSRARIMIMRDPWLDPYGDGYQLIQGYYAFGSGGLLGVGLGMSRQKYSYLPMAHNDFIFAVIGEELGFVGTVLLLAVFFGLVLLGYRIARHAVDLTGKLLAAGSVSMLAIQLLVNVCGVLGLIPLSGKPIPFISYGGSSIMSTLILVGLVLSVSRVAIREGSVRPARNFTVYEGTPARSFRVIDGGRGDSASTWTPLGDQYVAGGARLLANPNGSRRIDLGLSATERLRRR